MNLVRIDGPDFGISFYDFDHQMGWNDIDQVPSSPIGGDDQFWDCILWSKSFWPDIEYDSVMLYDDKGLFYININIKISYLKISLHLHFNSKGLFISGYFFQFSFYEEKKRKNVRKLKSS